MARGVEKLAKAYIDLATISLHATRNLKEGVLTAIIDSCTAIQAVVITVAKSHILQDTSIISFLDWLGGQSRAPDLRYLEFGGVHHDLSYGRQLDNITLRRPQLEIVYEWNDKAVLIRGSQRTPLSTRQDHGTAISRAGTASADPLPQHDEDVWEDATDSEEERRVARKARKPRKEAREMGRRIRYIGAQRSMSMMMGREIYDFEMQTSFRDGWDYSDDNDEEVDPREKKQMLEVMEGGFGFDD
ncbi:hypothetical protein PMIN02_000830 [Paraphaeosphaeria minitans]